MKRRITIAAAMALTALLAVAAVVAARGVEWT